VGAGADAKRGADDHDGLVADNGDGTHSLTISLHMYSCTVQWVLVLTLSVVLTIMTDWLTTIVTVHVD